MFLRIVKVRYIDLPLVFHSKRMLIPHQQENIGDFHIRDLEMTRQMFLKVRSWRTCTKSAMVSQSVRVVLSPSRRLYVVLGQSGVRMAKQSDSKLYLYHTAEINPQQSYQRVLRSHAVRP